ncbi:MAG: hypothetical protein ACE5GX_07155 [Thermoanaerobaculia bacterium]
MSCPVWEDLAASADELLQESSPERLRAERHFRECPECAGKAFLLDPSWAVRRMDDSEFDAKEISELQEELVESGRIRALDRRVGSRAARWRIAAAAALIALAAVAGMLANRSSVVSTAAVADPIDTVEPTRAAEVRTVDSGLADVSLPAIGSLAPAAARVYEIGEEDFALVMVVHETLDL